MAVPKRKVSRARRDKRRSNVWKLEAPALCKCTQCGELKLPHQYRREKYPERVEIKDVPTFGSWKPLHCANALSAAS